MDPQGLAVARCMRLVVVIDVVEYVAAGGATCRLQVGEAEHAHRQPDLTHLGATVVAAGIGQNLQDPVGLLACVGEVGQADARAAHADRHQVRGLRPRRGPSGQQHGAQGLETLIGIVGTRYHGVHRVTDACACSAAHQCQLLNDGGLAPRQQPVVRAATGLGGGDRRQPEGDTVQTHPSPGRYRRSATPQHRSHRGGPVLSLKVAGEPMVCQSDRDAPGGLRQRCRAERVQRFVRDDPDRAEDLVALAQRHDRPRRDVRVLRGQEERLGLAQHPLRDAEAPHLAAERVRDPVTEDRGSPGDIHFSLTGRVGQQPRLVVLDRDRRLEGGSEGIGNREQVADHLGSRHRVRQGRWHLRRQRRRDRVDARPAEPGRHQEKSDSGGKRLGQQWLPHRTVVPQHQSRRPGRSQSRCQCGVRAHAYREHQVTGLELRSVQRVVDHHGRELVGRPGRRDRERDDLVAESRHEILDERHSSLLPRRATTASPPVSGPAASWFQDRGSAAGRASGR